MPDLAGPVGAEFSRHYSQTWFLLAGVLLAAVTTLSGCQSPQKLEVTQSGVPKFDRFRAEYHFGQADRRLGRAFDIGAKGVGAESVGNSAVRTAAAESSWSAARLKIECPHPGGDLSLALLTLTLSDRRGATTSLSRDVRQLVISRSQVELLISDLANQGYFDVPDADAGSTQLEVQIDHGRIDRSWIDDARLLDLAHQTLTTGTSTAR
ncbi:MAG: hypothetical protein HQ518_16165 [Rhodopirellula sp.]|nr:hypothetical protein [Rhodopirellula sp.]